MLKLAIERRDLGGPWLWSGGAWRCGGSWIEPYAHPGLETWAVTDGSSWFAVGRERRRGGPPQMAGPNPMPVDPREYAHRLADARAWPGDYVLVEDAAGALRMSAGARGAAPVYLVAGAEGLHGSWDLAELRAHLDPDRLDELEVARLLALRPRYTHETVFTGVHRLTERATATWNGTNLAIQYPDAAEHHGPRAVRDGADVIGGYEMLLDQALDAVAYDPGAAAVELSGGVDSANVAASLAARDPGEIVTAAVLLPGAAGEQQHRRRAELIGQFGFRADVHVSAKTLAPLCPSGPRARGAAVTPYDECYLEAVEALHQAVAARGVRTLFTGVGGDEMVALTSAECTHAPVGVEKPLMPWIGERVRDVIDDAERDIAPVSVVNEMTLMACACAATPILRAGMWPVHPLADPAMVRFGEWLPRAWRADKRLPRDRLAAHGLPREVCRPPLAETFSGVMDYALTRHGVGYLRWMMAAGSPLIDGGFVDPDGVAAACDRFTAGRNAPRDRELFEVITLDVALRSLAGRPAAVG